MILGFTGTRKGMTSDQKSVAERQLADFKPSVFIHGGAIGSDSQAHSFIIKGPLPFLMPHTIEIYPEHGQYRFWQIPDHHNEARAAGRNFILHAPNKPLSRNLIIVMRCDRLLATPETEEEKLRSGTWATIRYARKIGKTITIINPDGSVRCEP